VTAPSKSPVFERSVALYSSSSRDGSVASARSISASASA
jgi:hypothetical protein